MLAGKPAALQADASDSLIDPQDVPDLALEGTGGDDDLVPGRERERLRLLRRNAISEAQCRQDVVGDRGDLVCEMNDPVGVT